MSTLIDWLDRYAPWIVPTIVTVAGIAAVWAICSVLAFLLRPLSKRARQAAADICNRWRESRSRLREQRSAKLDEAVAATRKRLSLQRVAQGSQTLLSHGGAEVLQPVNALLKMIQSNDDRLRSLSERMERLTDRLVSLSPLPATIELPSSEAAETDERKLSTARLNLGIAVVLLVALTTVNTGMLSQILKSFIPASLGYGWLKLYVVLAFLLTMVEAGCGVVHAWSEGDKRPLGHIPLASIFWLCVAVVIAGVEGFFYSRIAQGETFEIPGLGVTQAQVFFAWGMALVMVLFGCGRMAYRSAVDVLASSALRRVAGRVMDVRKSLEARTQALTEAKRAGEEAVSALTATNQSRVALLKDFNDAAAAVRNMVTSSLPIQPSEPSSAQDDVIELLSRSDIWMWLSVISAVASIAVYWAFLNDVSDLEPYVGLAVGLGVTALLFAAGTLLDDSAFLVTGGERPRVVSGRTPWIRLVAIAAVATATVVPFAVTTALWSAGGWPIWGLSIVTSAAVVVSGLQLSRLAPVMHIQWPRMHIRTARLGEAIVAVALWCWWALMALVDAVIQVISAPIHTLLDSRSRGQHADPI